MPGKLAHQLPKYMVPLHYVEIHALPRLESQKVDRKNLRKQTKGLVTQAQAQDALAEGGEEFVVKKRIYYLSVQSRLKATETQARGMGEGRS